MNTNYYYIGETLVEVKSSDILLKCISLFCHQEEINHETVDSFMKYEIIEEDSSERITELSKEYGAENNDGLVFQLLNVRYVYFEKKHLYIARETLINSCISS